MKKISIKKLTKEKKKIATKRIEMKFDRKKPQDKIIKK
jgi:hypothetical protein